jgi:hypothetical protein
MALVNVTHRPVTGTARQFDGTLAALTDIITGRPMSNASVVCGFNAAGNFTTLRVSGPAFGDVTVAIGDWVVFPTDPALRAMAVTAAAATAEWQTVP